MKTILAAALVTTILVARPAFASHSYDYATVVDVQPITKTVRVSTPRRECWEQEVVYRDRHRRGNGLGTVVGGVAGGLVGNAVGSDKRNKQVGAVVGAVLGATIGHSVSARRHEKVSYGVEERCKLYEDYHEEERVTGYHVRYRYNNETFSTRMDTHPGDTIKVRVSVSPVY